jgi:hypothetical protein
MGERTGLIEQIVKETLGPRFGVTETIEFRPDDDSGYICGYLVPPEPLAASGQGQPADAHQDEATVATAEEGDAWEERLAEDPDARTGSELEPDAGPDVVPSASASIPHLEPGKMPATMGISFLVQGDLPRIEACFTWARYGTAEKPNCWKRRPYGLNCEFDVPLPSGESRFRAGMDDGVEIVLRSRQNRRCPCWPRTESVVFQPQIRINPAGKTRIVPLPDPPTTSDEDTDRLRLLYRENPTMARGHLCAATWSTRDWQRSPAGADATAVLPPPRYPFVWEDGRSAFGSELASRFDVPAVRTDFVPLVTVCSPLAGWSGSRSVTPELDPEKLASLGDSGAIRRALEPLTQEYGKWIDEKEVESNELDAALAETAAGNIRECRAMLSRMKRGIELLCDHDNARLAFCFANRAMALQSAWSRRQRSGDPFAKPWPWYPFQLGFLLSEIESITDPTSEQHDRCDIIWFPTGGGKTEAYLGLVAFVLAYRRLRARAQGRASEGFGTAVLSRYTLRLLTIQQFRRALALVTACESMRVQGAVGWLPPGFEGTAGSMFWGSERFSIGLWVGGSVTPSSRFRVGQDIPGALDILQDAESGAQADPAQILRCPCCGAILAVTEDQMRPGNRLAIHWVVATPRAFAAPSELAGNGDFAIVGSPSFEGKGEYRTVTLVVEVKRWTSLAGLRALWGSVQGQLGQQIYLQACRPDRPGYFIQKARWGQMHAERPFDFEVCCPNPSCELGHDTAWHEELPSGRTEVIRCFRSADGMATRVPIPGFTVDDQIYGRCPSVVVATVDKLAMLAHKPEAATLFGAVEQHAKYIGYQRQGVPCVRKSPAIPELTDLAGPFRAPELVLQDELHLIEGPLGSMVGLYETVLDHLMSTATEGGRRIRAKYIASSATVRAARGQVRSLFAREPCVFPPSGLSASDSFFAVAPVGHHPLDETVKGRTYVGLCAPGSSPLIAPRNLWARLLQHGEDRRRSGGNAADLDPYWTLVNYFNAIRELAGAKRLIDQDVRERLARLSPDESLRRPLGEEKVIELSSRTESQRLPSLLEQLETKLASGQPPERLVDLLATTSMFGTGVDVSRLGLMLVHGQPKTTAAYIQASGRVGRDAPGLVAVILRAARPRDLSHYELFTGYHAALYRHVEPITVAPFSPRARERAIGPLAVVLLRNAREIGGEMVPADWRMDAKMMKSERQSAPVSAIAEVFEARGQAQWPEARQPASGVVRDEVLAHLDAWQRRAADQLPDGTSFEYLEWTMSRPARNVVVLGDRAHREIVVPGQPPPIRPGCVYPNTPTSMREVEPTTAFDERVPARRLQAAAAPKAVAATLPRGSRAPAPTRRSRTRRAP